MQTILILAEIFYFSTNSKKTKQQTSTFPIQTSGHAVVTLFAGIKTNGISATRQPYEFYESLTLDTTVKPGTTAKYKHLVPSKTPVVVEVPIAKEVSVLSEFFILIPLVVPKPSKSSTQ